MLNLVIGLLLGGCIAAVILCCIQINRVGRCEQESRRLKEKLNTNIEIKIRHLMMVLSAVPDIEIGCTDSCECFDDNKAYLQERLEDEPNPHVRRLLKQDMDFLDHIQVEMATARQFLFIGRCKGMNPGQVFDTANRIEKVISEQGFEVRRMKKEDIKRFLALYFDASMNGEQMPDVDGGQFFEQTTESAV